jgi:hypothetical protein
VNISSTPTQRATCSAQPGAHARRHAALPAPRALTPSASGVKSFYVPRSHPDGFSVNVRCLEPGTLGEYELQVFDDSQREASTAKFASLSAE